MNELQKYIHEDEFEVVECFDQTCLFSDCRVPREVSDLGLYVYDLRSDDGDIIHATIEKSVTVDHAGTLITKKPIDCCSGDEPYQFTEDTSPDFLGEEMTIAEFMDLKGGQQQ